MTASALESDCPDQYAFYAEGHDQNEALVSSPRGSETIPEESSGHRPT